MASLRRCGRSNQVRPPESAARPATSALPSDEPHDHQGTRPVGPCSATPARQIQGLANLGIGIGSELLRSASVRPWRPSGQLPPTACHALRWAFTHRAIWLRLLPDARSTSGSARWPSPAAPTHLGVGPVVLGMNAKNPVVPSLGSAMGTLLDETVVSESLARLSPKRGPTGWVSTA